MKYIIFIFLIAILLTGCRVVKVQKETTTNDTLVITKTVIVRDTIIKTQAALVKVIMDSNAFKQHLKPIQKQFKNAKLTIKKEEDKIIVDCFCDTITIKAQIRDKLEKEYKTRVKTIETIKKTTPTFFEKLLSYIDIIGWLVALSLIIKTILKKKR